MARVAESGIDRKDLVVINSHHSQVTVKDDFRVHDQREREQWCSQPKRSGWVRKVGLY